MLNPWILNMEGINGDFGHKKGAVLSNQGKYCLLLILL